MYAIRSYYEQHQACFQAYKAGWDQFQSGGLQNDSIAGNRPELTLDRLQSPAQPSSLSPRNNFV